MHESLDQTKETDSQPEKDRLPTAELLGGIIVGPAFSPSMVHDQLEEMPYMG